MTMTPTRRTLLANMGMSGIAAIMPRTALAARPDHADPIADYRTPYKYGKLVLGASHETGSFDERLADCPFVFSANDRFYLTYAGWDGTGYQTGMAESRDLIHWTNRRLILARDPNDPVTRYNVNMATILRENELYSPGRLEKVNGRYLGAWHAYPNAGYEEGRAAIGLAWSDDLLHWERTPPILFPQDGIGWEAGGLYKPYLLRDGDTFYLFYNAKTKGDPWHEQTGVAMSNDLKTWTRFPGNPIIRNGPQGAPDDWFASDPVVYRHNGEWVLFYFGRTHAGGGCCELMARGKTLTDFTKASEVLISKGPPGSVDDDFAHKPSLIYRDGTLYHFYCAVSGKWPNDVRGLSVARSKPW
jgi:predicted GH43/DUF377 family glycosyl hydrolase